MRKFLFLFFYCGLCIMNPIAIGSAFSQNWSWAHSAGSGNGGDGEGFNVATDASGNLYVTGFFSYSITFGTNTLNSAGGTAVFLAKYDSAGNVLWAKSAGGGGSDRGNSVAADAFGNVYITGLFRSASITFGSTTLINAGNSDFFLTKYDSSGNVIWAKRAGGPGFDGTGDFTGNTVATDRAGNIFVTGCFSSPSIAFGATTLLNTGGNDFFIAKYDSSGSAVWATGASGTGDDAGTSVATDTSGSVYVAGYFGSSAITFGIYTLNLAAGYSDMFLVKFNSSGNIIHAMSAAVGVMTINVPFNFCVATDAAQNVFVTGGFQASTVTFGPYTLTNNSTGGCNMFVAKYDSACVVSWASSAGGQNYDCGYSVSVDPWGYAYVTGVFSLIGNTSISFGSIMLNFPAGGLDPMFIVKYDPAGNPLCAAALASGGDDNNGVVADAFGNAYIGGDFMVSPFVVGTTLLNLTGGEDVFVAKYICDSISSILPISAFTAPNNICPGTCTGFTNLSTNATSFLWTFTGGNPASSIDVNPVNICYTSPGNYSVSLIATNTNGSDTLTLNNYITVFPAPPPQSIIQSGDTLFALPGAGTYQWYFNGNIINGATNYFYVAPTSGDYNVVATDANECEVEAAVFNVTAGLQSTVDSQQLMVFPNPVEEELSISNLQNATTSVSVYDMIGKKVYSTEEISGSGIHRGQLTVDCRLLPSGLYYIEIAIGEKISRNKFLKQ
ncbi:hypothetical protein BH11BAC1_BH11BAC1_02690 [soil metagenome]